MASPALTAGSSVIVEYPSDEGAQRASAMIDAVQDDSILIGKLEGYELPELDERTPVSLIVLEHHQMFNIGCVVSRSGDETIRLLMNTAAERVSRRQYVRVSTVVPVSCLILDAATNTWSAVDASVSDMSGGGLALAANAIVPAGVTVAISIAIPGDHPVVAIGRSLHTDAETRKVINLSTKGPMIRLEYVAIREADRERLMKYVFSEMLKQRRSEVEAEELRRNG